MTSEQKARSSIWGYTLTRQRQTHTHGSEDFDMQSHKIINLGTPSRRHHAATAGYVSNYISYLNTHKFDKAGGVMTGNVDMDNNKVINVGTPTDETDVVNKQYVDSLVQHEHDTRPYDLGRYIVFPHDSGSKTYFSVRARKNIDLDSDKLVEVKHNIKNASENEINNRPQDITITKDTTMLPNPEKKLGIMELNAPLQIDFRLLRNLVSPWTLLFSARPGETPPRDGNNSVLTFYNSANQAFKYLTTMWTADSFKYTITDDVMTNANAIVHNVDTDKLNHIAIEYTGTKLCVWFNGRQEQMHNETLGELSTIIVGVEKLGIISLYSRNLNKQEIVQHFVDHHVENFTNDEVLI